jgi:hypothetical protein
MKKWIAVFVTVAAGFFLAVCVIRHNQARQARFTVDILQRYISALERITDLQVLSWDDLPDFDIISPDDSLRLRLADLKRNAFHAGGYVYDLQSEGDDLYVISASPVGLLSPRAEYGITDQGVLKENTRQVDPLPDSRGEVSAWKAIERIENARTRELPEYLRD